MSGIVTFEGYANSLIECAVTFREHVVKAQGVLQGSLKQIESREGLAQKVQHTREKVFESAIFDNYRHGDFFRKATLLAKHLDMEYNLTPTVYGLLVDDEAFSGWQTSQQQLQRLEVLALESLDAMGKAWDLYLEALEKDVSIYYRTYVSCEKMGKVQSKISFLRINGIVGLMAAYKGMFDARIKFERGISFSRRYSQGEAAIQKYIMLTVSCMKVEASKMFERANGVFAYLYQKAENEKRVQALVDSLSVKKGSPKALVSQQKAVGPKTGDVSTVQGARSQVDNRSGEKTKAEEFMNAVGGSLSVSAALGKRTRK